MGIANFARAVCGANCQCLSVGCECDRKYFLAMIAGGPVHGAGRSIPNARRPWTAFCSPAGGHEPPSRRNGNRHDLIHRATQWPDHAASAGVPQSNKARPKLLRIGLHSAARELMIAATRDE